MLGLSHWGMFTLVSYLPLQILQKQQKKIEKPFEAWVEVVFCSLFGQNYDNNDNDDDDDDDDDNNNNNNNNNNQIKKRY